MHDNRYIDYQDVIDGPPSPEGFLEQTPAEERRNCELWRKVDKTLRKIDLDYSHLDIRDPDFTEEMRRDLLLKILEDIEGAAKIVRELLVECKKTKHAI